MKLAIFVAALALAACSGDGRQTPPPGPGVSAECLDAIRDYQAARAEQGDVALTLARVREVCPRDRWPAR